MLDVFLFLGPNLPYALSSFSVVESPTKKGLMIIGGFCFLDGNPRQLLEFCGDSVDTLTYKHLNISLKTPRSGHGSFLLDSAMVTKWLEEMGLSN